jgi:excisionase family DNA binding protein
MKTLFTTSPERYTLNGKNVDISGLEEDEKEFVCNLLKMKEKGEDYFRIYRAAVGPGSLALQGGNTLLPQYAESLIYRIALDVATRAGIEQGLILDPESDPSKLSFPDAGEYLSIFQAADYIGISRAAVYKAIKANRLESLRIGNLIFVKKKEAEKYKLAREESCSGLTHAGSRAPESGVSSPSPGNEIMRGSIKHPIVGAVPSVQATKPKFRS